MSVTGATPECTYSEYARLPDDGNCYEVIDGEVCVTPAPGPPHQRTAAELFIVLKEYVQQHELGEMLWDVDLLFVSASFCGRTCCSCPVMQRAASRIVAWRRRPVWWRKCNRRTRSGSIAS